MTVNLNNTQFKQFVQFAEQQSNPAKSEAIARVTGGRDALPGARFRFPPQTMSAAG